MWNIKCKNVCWLIFGTTCVKQFPGDQCRACLHIIYTNQVFSGLLHHYQTLRWHFGDDSNQCDECNHLALVHSLQSAKASLSCPLTSQTFVLEIFLQQWFTIFYNLKAYRCASRQLRSFFCQYLFDLGLHRCCICAGSLCRRPLQNFFLNSTFNFGTFKQIASSLHLKILDVKTQIQGCT